MCTPCAFCNSCLNLVSCCSMICMQATDLRTGVVSYTGGRDSEADWPCEHIHLHKDAYGGGHC